MSAYSPKIPDVGLAAARRAPILLLAALLAACAPQRSLELPELRDWQARRATLAALDQWEFRGRIAVKAGEEGFNGNLDWWQNRALYVASVSGPFGAGTVRIEGDENFVRITDADGTVDEMQDIERELQRRYGWTIPAASLRYWALGIPDPAARATTEFGDDGLLRRLEQRDWVVTIDEYRESGGQPMPRRMTATNPDTRVRLVVDRWIFR